MNLYHLFYMKSLFTLRCLESFKYFLVTCCFHWTVRMNFKKEKISILLCRKTNHENSSAIESGIQLIMPRAGAILAIVRLLLLSIGRQSVCMLTRLNHLQECPYWISLSTISRVLWLLLCLLNNSVRNNVLPFEV